MEFQRSLQETFAPNNICFGCGPRNAQGLQLKSFPRGNELVAEFQPAPHHQAFAGKLNGGIIGTVLDCHCNWTAAWHLMQKLGLETPPCTVTAEYTIRMLQPTPADELLHLRARVVESSDRRAVVEGEIRTTDGRVTAQCRGTFVAVKEGHPAFHRW